MFAENMLYVVAARAIKLSSECLNEVQGHPRYWSVWVGGGQGCSVTFSFCAYNFDVLSMMVDK